MGMDMTFPYVLVILHFKTFYYILFPKGVV